MTGFDLVFFVTFFFLVGVGVGMWIPRLIQAYNKRGRSRIAQELHHWRWPEGSLRSQANAKRRNLDDDILNPRPLKR